jgi:hypothetical protein
VSTVEKLKDCKIRKKICQHTSLVIEVLDEFNISREVFKNPTILRGDISNLASHT